MDPRFTELFRLPPNVHQDGCPAFINTGVIIRDNYSGQALAQIILGSLSAHPIVACSVEIRTFAVNGQPLDTIPYSYLDIRVPVNAYFGGNVSIPLPNPNARRLQVLVREVVTDPFRVWKSEDDTLYPLPQPTRLETVLPDPRHVQHYSGLIGKNGVFVPKIEQGLFVCTCGQLNVAEEGPCKRCGSTFDALNAPLDPEAIHAAVMEQFRQEEEARIAAERAAEEARVAAEQAKAEALAAKKAKQKVARKRALKITAILAVLAILACVAVFVVIPGVENANAYKAAAALLEEDRYTEAEAAFLALGDYKDAATQALECRYQLAESYVDNEDYQTAIDIFNSLGRYNDSDDRAEEVFTQWKDREYDAAMALKNSGAYLEAAEAFAALDGYRDSMAQQADCLLIQMEMDYNTAMEMVSNGDYLGAMAIFRHLDDYADAAVQYASAAYQHARALFDIQDFQAAIRYFTEAGDFEDAAQRVVESTYKYGCQLLKDENFTAAISAFEECLNHADTAKKILEAKLGYAKTHMDPDNKTTYAYLKELLAANYYGARQVYNDLYAWKVTIVAYNNNPYDSSSNQSSLSKYQQMCVHYKVTGGEPGATQTIRTVIKLPSGYTGTVYNNGAQAGYTYCTYGWYDTPAYGATGTLYFWAYDEAGNLIGSGSVKVTN